MRVPRALIVVTILLKIFPMFLEDGPRSQNAKPFKGTVSHRPTQTRKTNQNTRTQNARELLSRPQSPDQSWPPERQSTGFVVGTICGILLFPNLEEPKFNKKKRLTSQRRQSRVRNRLLLTSAAIVEYGTTVTPKDIRDP